MIWKVRSYGGDKGEEFDDGVYDGLGKVIVGEDGDRVSYIEFEYVRGNKSITHCHGKKPHEPKQFMLDYENNEYVKSVEGKYDEDGFISSLTFKTSKGRISEEFGKAVGTVFILEVKGFNIVGFRGRSSNDHINALGAHFAAMLIPPAKKLEAFGLTGEGVTWDDGVHDNVRKITVQIDMSAVWLVKFEYTNGKKTVVGDDHGYNISLSAKTAELKLSENEYITSVEGFYGRKFTSGSYSVTMLKFKTNKGISHMFGYDTKNYEGSTFVLEEKDHKIVGFHGESSLFLKKIGVYVLPINYS